MDVLNTPGRRLSESSAAREGKPHVRFEVAGDGNQETAMALRHPQKKWGVTSCFPLRLRRHPLTLPPEQVRGFARTFGEAAPTPQRACGAGGGFGVWWLCLPHCPEAPTVSPALAGTPRRAG